LTPIGTGNIKGKEEKQNMHNGVHRVATNSRTNAKGTLHQHNTYLDLDKLCFSEFNSRKLT
jgi:hypothetical protein